MSRPLRIEFPGALYHLTSRGDGRSDIYLADDDRVLFLSVLGQVCERFNWECHSYCLMTNHYHLMIETPEGNLSQGMRQLNGVYTQRFNQSHRRVGHVFQGRYKSILVQKESYLLELSRYIVLNPVRADMVAKAETWKWSSYRHTVGLETPPSWLQVNWLLSCFGKRRSSAIAKYKTYVDEGKGQSSPWSLLKKQVFLGDDDFIEAMESKIDKDRDFSEVPLSQRRAKVQPLKQYEVMHKDRNKAILVSFRSGGYTMKAIADHFKLHYSTVSKIIKLSLHS
jgi:putative transposase